MVAGEVVVCLQTSQLGQELVSVKELLALIQLLLAADPDHHPII